MSPPPPPPLPPPSPPTPPTRRQFLTGKAARDAILHLADGNKSPKLAESSAAGADEAHSPASPQPQPSPSGSYLLHVARTAMACEFAVYLNGVHRSNSMEAAVAALDLVDALENQLSIYRPDSDMSRINQQAQRDWVPVDADLFGLLERAMEIWRDTDGAFDITSGALSQAWGFARRAGSFPQPHQLAAALNSTGSQFLELEAVNRSVRIQRLGLQCNLGGIGKGYALDQAGKILRQAGANDFLMHGGSSSVVAAGSRTGQSGWRVDVAHPLRKESKLATVRLHNQALATSGSAMQCFYHHGKRYGHIIDPRTGLPADRVLSATVVAADATSTDALATAFYVMGPDEVRRYCESHHGIAALLAMPGQRSGDVELDFVGDADWHVA